MLRISRNQNLATHKTGNVVELDGWYVCVPCGYKKYLKKGERFPECLQCLKGEKGKFQKGLELWERV